MRLPPIPKEALTSRLAQINQLNGSTKPRWSVVDKDQKQYLFATYKFKTFSRTWTFLNEVATAADSIKHHPEIFTVYNKVDLWLTTHDSGNQVTEKDLELAQEAESILAELKRRI
ncbi:hypothetical protein DICA3_F14378 [Diutina catenulata]